MFEISCFFLTLRVYVLFQCYLIVYIQKQSLSYEKNKTKQPSNFRAYKGYPSLFKKLTLNVKDQAQALSKNQNQGQITKLLDSYRRQL